MTISPTQILLILVIILLLFGAKKLPDLARSVGRSTRILKSEMREMSNDDAQYQNTHNAQQHQQQAINQQNFQQPQPQQNYQNQSQQQPNTNAENFWNKPENQPRSQN
ncbi:Sec-independent protein translocase subunit TatA [Corynebacterium pseudodiphtheriticum]|uniref:Sec-independent protein translocase subunit TatA n=1 Tax=Corynebacterium pseudodiphtheriticum TaxID=37637 RepID=UPI00234E32B0|nr:Sec-independent protein translocase subunit TatA [Corynebacterium pseudodiphtheriticum]MDC7088337.1 Sec-independent protein translocase subunit TatA [Corynebacterium pseudodiphtheriticum]MDK4321547.1 Sec-independent protein translocase subunit TatA [Corynebacterium pseudodiphtheriticum]